MARYLSRDDGIAPGEAFCEALDLATGAIHWSHEPEPTGPQTACGGRYITPHGYASSSAVTDGSGVYFFLGDLGRSGTTYLVPAEPRFELLATNPLGEPGEVFNGSPALVGGRLLIRSDRAIYCIGC